MKKGFSAFILSLTMLPLLTACGKYDYTQHLSEVKSDLFTAETEEFSVTLSCVSREYPYASDGVAAQRSELIEIVLVSNVGNLSDFRVFVTGANLGGEMSFRNTRGDYFFSQGVKEFPKESVSLRVEWENETREIVATSVKNGDTLTPEQALGCAVKAERETVGRMTENGAFQGEFRVRLLRRSRNYYYVGIVAKDGSELALLLNGESGEVLARRENS